MARFLHRHLARGLATTALIRSGTGLDMARLHAPRGPEWLVAEWVSQMDLIGD
jgi:hypothetical protein